MPSRLLSNRQRALLLGLSAGAFAGCGVPTDLADWDMTWSIPTKGTTISVNSFLPTGVSAVGNSFSVSVSPVSITRRLGDDCTGCAQADGFVVPKPAFIGSGTTSTTLPSNVASAVLGTNAVTVNLRHNYSFDPLRPSATARGWLRIVATSNNGAVVGRDSINGASTSFAPNTDLVRTITLSGTVGSSGVIVTTTLDSPAGDATLMQSSASLTAQARFSSLTVTSAQVNLTSQTVNADPVDLDFSDIDAAVRDRVQSGTLTLTIGNPFTATGSMTLTFNGPSPAITKSINLGAGNTTQEITLNKSELRSLLGRKNTLVATGRVNGSAVAITPGQTASVATRMMLTITREAQP